MPNKSNSKLSSVLVFVFFVLLSALTPSIRNEDKAVLALTLLVLTPLSVGIHYFWRFKQIPVGERILFPLILWPLGLAISYGIGRLALRNLFNLFFEEDSNGGIVHDYVFLSNLSINVLTTACLVALLRGYYFLLSKS